MFRKIISFSFLLLTLSCVSNASESMNETLVAPAEKHFAELEPLVFTPAQELFEELDGIVPVQPQAANGLEKKAKVRFTDEVEVITFINRRVVRVIDGRRWKEYTLPLTQEGGNSYTDYVPTGQRIYRGIFPDQRKSMRTYTMEEVAQKADFCSEWVCRALECKDPTYVSRGQTFLKETNAADAAFIASKWYKLIPASYEHELEIEEVEVDPKDVEGVRTRAFNNYMASLNIGIKAFFKVIQKTENQKEFHISLLRFNKIVHNLRQLGKTEAANIWMTHLDEIVHSRMAELHSRDAAVININKIISRYASLEKQQAHWAEEVSRIKATKGTKNHRRARLNHANNMLEATQRELADYGKRHWATLARDWQAYPLYACEEQSGCADCHLTMQALEEWKTL